MKPTFRIRTHIGEDKVSSLPWSGGWITMVHYEDGKSDSYDSSSIAEMSQKHLALAKQLRERQSV